MIAINVALFGFALLDTGALLFLSIYILITLSDLDCDYLNPMQCCDKLSKVILFFFFWSNFENFHNLSFIKVDHSGIDCSWNKHFISFYDPSEIHVRGNLKSHIKISFIRMVFHLVHFFIYLYLFVVSLLTQS
ncbi:Cornichon-like protein [Sarcoptes scabiei]|uniref:Cornichon-like protein n=1 Tax=Sarcoptes scabiei TaxID=52283 RepID=A0A132A7K2_SARSC|nr:Cornichon-like protein [Sarcoptes scabiei]